MLRRIVVMAAIGLTVGCAQDVPGTSPSLTQLRFPIGAELVRGATTADDHLVICNSEFDQRFNAGSLMALNVDALFEATENADLRNPSTELPTRGSVKVPLLCGDLEYAPERSADGSAIPGKGYLFVAARAANYVTMVSYDNGNLACAGAGDLRRTIDCTEGHLIETGTADPFSLSVSPALDVAPLGVLAVGHFGDLRDPSQIILIDIQKFEQRAGGAVALDDSPILFRETTAIDGVSGLEYLPAPLVGAPRGTFVAAGLRSNLDVGVPLATYDLRTFEDVLTLRRVSKVNAGALEGVIGTRNLIVSADGTRAYTTVRMPEQDGGGSDPVRYNSAVVVLSIDATELRFVAAYEVGEELGSPALLERPNGQRLVYVPDHRTHKIWVLDATSDALTVAGSVRPLGERDGPEGPIRINLLSTPTSITFATRGSRTLGFVGNFGNSTLGVIDVTDPDPSKHQVVARLGQDLDANGESEIPE